jgi:hypothetical protein
MEATPPDEPIQKKPPASVRARSRKQKPVAAPLPVEPVVEPAPAVEVDTEQEATRVLGVLALGVMALLLFCVIALLIAYRNVPEGL